MQGNQIIEVEKTGRRRKVGSAKKGYAPALSLGIEYDKNEDTIAISISN